MSSLETTIANIEAKVRRLVEENASLRIKVDKQETTIAELRENINNNNIIINNLKEENNKLITSRNTPHTGCDTSEIESRINHLINTIDHSLALLDDKEK